MSSRAVVNPNSVSPQEESEHGSSEQDSIRWGGFAGEWAHDHINAIAILMVAAGFVARLIVAGRSYLNPDEALDYLIVNQSSLFHAYKASLEDAHPPLIYLVLHYSRFLGSSELMLRLPSVLFGTVFCWIMYRWMGIALGKPAGVIGLIFVTFSPTLIALSAEVRPYALLLVCIAAALNFIELAFREKSVRNMWYFSIFLYLAILTQYSAVFFVLALGLYSLARIAGSQLPRKVVAAWVCGQAGAAAIYVFLYITHVSKIRNSISSWATPFDQSYFHLGRENIFAYTWKNTPDIFQFTFGLQYVSYAMLLLFAAGMIMIFAGDSSSRRGKTRSSHVGLLLLLPFVAIWGAGIAGVYPYVGDRHTVFLAPFEIAAVSFFLASVFRQRLWAGLLIAAVLMCASDINGVSMETGILQEAQSRILMSNAVNFMQQSIPPSDLILADYQSTLEIAYYLCGPKVIFPIDAFNGMYFKTICDGHSIVSIKNWKFLPEDFPNQFENMARTHGLKPGDRVWVFAAGWTESLASDLPSTSPQFHCLVPRKFGSNISVIPFVVGQDLSPAAPVTNCSQP